MTTLLIALNIIAGLFLVAVVLLQAGKGADMGAAFGGANPGVFGPTGQGNVLQKVTAATAVVFMSSSLALAVLSARQESVFDETTEPSPLSAPAAIPGADDTAAVTPPSAEQPAGEANAPPASGEDVDQAASSPPSGAALGDSVPTPQPGAASPPAEIPAAVPVPVTPPPAASAPEAPTGSGAQ